MGVRVLTENDRQRLTNYAADHAFELVLCWRTDDITDADALVEHLATHLIA